MKSYNGIYFLRHLKTLNNKKGIISGQGDSEIIQKEYLKINLKQFDKIFCSPSLRCRETLKRLGNDFFSADNIVYDKYLLERDMGKLEGMLKLEAEMVYPELFINGSFNVFRTPPQGESFGSFESRIYKFYNEILNTDEQLNVLICSHNQTLKLLRLLILKKDISYQSWSEYSFKNGKVIEKA